MKNLQNQSALFLDRLRALGAQRKYVKLYYFSDLNELLSLTALVTGVVTQENRAVLVAASGEHIPVERLANVNGVQNPVFTDYETCLACRCDR